MMKSLFVIAGIAMILFSCYSPKEEDTGQVQAYRIESSPMHVFQLAHLDGDADSVQAIGNYSGDTVWFVLKAPANDYISINRVIVGIEDATITNSNQYGALAALTTGVQVRVRDSDSTLLETLTPFAVKTNGGWAEVCYDMTIHDLGAGNDFAVSRWTFGNSGKPINLKPGQFISVELSDDFTGLVDHQFFFQGYYQDETY